MFGNLDAEMLTHCCLHYQVFKVVCCKSILRVDLNGGGSICNTITVLIYCRQDLKNIKNVKGCRDGMPKSMQTR